MKTAIINYGMGNISSVAAAVEYCNAEPFICDNFRDLAKADVIVLPGVGSFARAMENLNLLGLSEKITELVTIKQVKFLGICLGMQLAADAGTEGGDTKGLGLVNGLVRRIDSCNSDVRVPHIGFNSILSKKTHEKNIFSDIPFSDFYFVHSYFVDFQENENSNVFYTNYGFQMPAAYSRDNILLTQFHPEKSQNNGLMLLKKFLS